VKPGQHFEIAIAAPDANLYLALSSLLTTPPAIKEKVASSE